MKKLLTMVLCLMLGVSLVACTTPAAAVETKRVEGALTDLFAEIYKNTGVEAPMLQEFVVDDANKAGMLGTDEVAIAEGLASEAAIMTIPHSMVLIRVPENTDIEKTKQLIRDNVNPRKWICVGVEADQVIVDSIGDLVFLVMSANAQAYHDSFLKLGA